MHMKKLSIGVTGNTLHYFTGVTGAINPETGMSSGDGQSMYEAVATDKSDTSARPNIFPSNRRVLFNVKITF